MKINELELIPVYTESNPLTINEENLNSVIADNFDTLSFVVAYLDYKVLIGTWNKEFHFFDNEKFENKYIQKLRVFDENKELLIWRTSEGLKGRLRTDKKGTETEIVVAYQVLFGTKKGKSCNEEFTEIIEDRGTSLILPFGNIKFNDDGTLVSRICIKTHNYIGYIGYNDVNQATYVDCRFVGFTDGNGKELSYV